MSNGVKIVIAIGAVLVTTQVIGVAISKSMLKSVKESFNSDNDKCKDDYTFVEVEEEDK